MILALKKVGEFIVSRLIAGVFVIAPIYLTGLLLVKIIKSLSRFFQPIGKLLPEWLPAEQLLSLLLVLCACVLVGIVVHGEAGQAAWRRIERAVFWRIPGYKLVRGVTQRIGGEAQDKTWKPALAEIEEALVPAFIIEELKDGSITVFVPAAPTPFTGSIYILSPDRVHPVNISFTHALKIISGWGLGAAEFVAAMEKNATPSSDPRRP